MDFDDEEEEEVDVDSSESDDDRGLRRQALEVDGEPDFSVGPPMDGFEYLRRVAYEARQTPDIMRAENFDASAFATTTATTSSLDNARRDEESEYSPPPWAKPDREWTRRTVGDFSDLRVHISRALASISKRGVERLYPSNRDKREWEQFCAETHEPPLGALLAMDAVTCAHLLRRVCRALCKHDYESEAADGKDIFTLLRWFHALSARVDLPLDADTEASIRSAMKGVARGRASTKSSDDPLIPHLNLAIAVGGGYFKQWRGE